MKIVIDTNVFISALIKEGNPRNLLFEIMRNHKLIMSKEILVELAITVNHPKIQKYTNEQDTADFIVHLTDVAKMAKVKSKFKVVKEDPEDDIILKTAYDGNADYIVSGDRHLLDLKEFHGVQIVSVARMLEIIEKACKRL